MKRSAKTLAAMTAKLNGYDALLPTFRSTGERIPMPEDLLD